MSQIICIYGETPNFPPTNQHPLAARYTLGGWIIDALNGAPTQGELDVFRGVDAATLAAKQAEADRVAGINADAQRIALLNQLKTATAAQIDTYVDNNVTDLASARTMLKRIVKVLAVLVK